MPQSLPAVPIAPSLRVLLSGLVDYAGLFPPATLPMPAAVEKYAAYRRDRTAWMLGRFIVPVASLAAFEAAAAAHWRTAGPPWRLSAIVGDEHEAELAAVTAFNDRHREEVTRAGDAAPGDPSRPPTRLESVARIESVELKADSPDDVRRKAALLPAGVEAWFEVTPGDALEETLFAVQGVGHGGKLRTGSTDPNRIPSSDAVARFMFAAVRAGVPFKATAGLHHPMRGTYALNYEKNSPSVSMHGFINLFLAAALARESISLAADQEVTREAVVELLDEIDPAAFTWTADVVRWRETALHANTLAETRQAFARSFGSCSFDEPLTDLHTLGWL